MKISVIVLFLLLIPNSILSQVLISGSVTDNKGVPIMGANIYLEGTYDGSSSDENGKFSFETSESGSQTLIVSYVSFEPFKMTDAISKMKDLKIILRSEERRVGKECRSRWEM